MIKTINFTKAPHRLSRGRNGFFKTSGIEIFLEQFGATNEPNQDDCVSFYSITSKGKASEAARIAISVEALPQVIMALQDMLAEATKTEWPTEGKAERYEVFMERPVMECRSVVVQADSPAHAVEVALTADFDEDQLDDWTPMDPGEITVYEVDPAHGEPLTPICLHPAP